MFKVLVSFYFRYYYNVSWEKLSESLLHEFNF